MWNYLAHKTRKPWVPMVAVVMVAEEFGSGRGTLFDILELLFGENYVAPCTFGQLTGTSASARFNARLADALFIVVNEAVAEDGHLQSQRRLDYEALKNVIEPSPTARRPYEARISSTSCAVIRGPQVGTQIRRSPRGSLMTSRWLVATSTDAAERCA
jgi:hypothetical protein